MNSINIIGTITKDLELKESSTGTKFVKFTIAVNRKYKNENGEYETDFFRVAAWRKTAEFISEYFGKGKRIGISGRLQNVTYTDNEGVERTFAEIVADDVQLIERKKEDSVAPQDFITTENVIKTKSDLDDEVFANFGDSIEINDEDIAF